MTPRWPDWYGVALLALAAYRIVRLIGLDTITEKPREALTCRTDRVSRYLSALVTCPWCVGFYVCLGFWAAWLVWPRWTLCVCVPLALSALVGLVSKTD